MHLDDHPQAFSQGLSVVAGRSEATGAQELTDVLWVDRHPQDREAVTLPPPVCRLPGQHARIIAEGRGAGHTVWLERGDATQG